jgi:repressor LexA
MSGLNQLTDRQHEIYEYIREQIENHGYPPAIRDICDAFKIKSPNGVMCHLRALEKKGLITRGEGLARAIRLADHRSPGPALPFLGRVAAGNAIEAIEDAELFDFGKFCGPGHFALKVKGNSMIEDHIDDGDFVVIRMQENAENGQRVVAMIDGDVTLKKYYKKRDVIRLEPSNSDLEAIVVTPDRNIKILGVLKGVMRMCK